MVRDKVSNSNMFTNASICVYISYDMQPYVISALYMYEHICVDLHGSWGLF